MLRVWCCPGSSGWTDVHVLFFFFSLKHHGVNLPGLLGVMVPITKVVQCLVCPDWNRKLIGGTDTGGWIARVSHPACVGYGVYR